MPVMKVAKYFWFTALLVSQPRWAGGQPSEGTNTLLLSNVIAQVSERNPLLKAARARWEAMRERVPQAQAWPDPRVGLDVERSNTRLHDFHDNEWMIAQELPLSGKNRQRAAGARAEAAAAWSDFRRRELDLVARSRIAYFRYANAHVQLEINRRNDGLLSQFVETTRDKYRFGTRMQSDVLMAETERIKNLEAGRDLERQFSDAQSELNVLMHRPARADLPPPEPLQFQQYDMEPNRWTRVALENRPELERTRYQIDAEKARAKLARRAWIPDPEVRVEARQFEGRGGGFQEYDTGIFFNIPWVNRGKYKAAIREADLNRKSAEHELESLQSSTEGAVRDQLKKIETLHHHYSLFKEKILPLAQQTVEANRSAYSSDKSTFLELIEAQRTVQEVEAMVYHHLTDYLVSIAELETLTGVRAGPTNAPASTVIPTP